MDAHLHGESYSEDLRRTISKTSFLPHITRAIVARDGIKIPPMPEAGRPVTAEPTESIPEPHQLPSGPTTEENDYKGSDRLLTDPDVLSNIDREDMQEICNHRLQPFHQN